MQRAKPSKTAINSGFLNRFLTFYLAWYAHIPRMVYGSTSSVAIRPLSRSERIDHLMTHSLLFSHAGSAA